MLRKPIIAVAFIFVIASGAQAARLTDIEGTVLVNTGEGFREVVGKAVVSAGDRVLVRGKGGARIDYGAGCVTKVQANQTVVIAAEPTCPAARPTVSLKETAPVKEVPAPPPFNDGLAEQRILIVGGLVVVGSAAAAIVSKGEANKAGSSGPASETPAPVVSQSGDNEKAARVVGTRATTANAPAAPGAPAPIAPANGGKIEVASTTSIENAPSVAKAELAAVPVASNTEVFAMAARSSEATMTFKHEEAAIAFNSGELADGSPVSP